MEINDQLGAKVIADISRKPFHGVESHGTLSFDNGGHVLTIGAATNKYWYLGRSYVTAAAITCDIDDYETITANTLYYFYFDDASGTLKCNTSFWDLKAKVPVATVYWNGSAGAIQAEYHGHQRDVDWHINAHLTIGCRYYTGGLMTYPDASHDASLQIETATLYDEDLQIVTGQCTTMRGWYQASSGVYTFADYAFPYLGASGDPYWLDTDDYTLKSVDDSKYVCYWYYGTSDIDRPIYVIPTQAADPYNTVGLARNEKPPALTGLALNPEWRLLYKTIYRGDGEFQEKVDYRQSSSLPAGGTSAVSAAGVTFVASGNIAATNVQAAIEELDSEKLSNELWGFALSDVTSDLVIGQKIAFDMPCNFTITRVYASVSTAPVGSSIQIDIEDEGTSILNAVLEIAASGTNAETSTFASAATSYSFSKGDLISFDVDQIGSSTAGKELYVFIEGVRS